MDHPEFDSIYPATKPNGQNPKVGVGGIIFNARWCVIDNLHARNIDTCISLFPHSHYLFLNNPKFEPLEVRGANLYCGGLDESIERGDVYWIGGSGKSEQEHPVRCSTAGFHGLYCNNVTFTADTGKECVAFRQGSGLVVDHCSFNGVFGTFLGETGPQSDICNDITIQNSEFHPASTANGDVETINVRAAKNIKILNNKIWPIVGGRFDGIEIQIVSGNASGVVVRGNTRFVNSMNPSGRRLRAVLNVPPFTDGGGNTNQLVK
jgi:hypothetical protein